MDGDADFGAVAAAIGHPARAAILAALLGGRALPAAALAREAGVAAPTASGHLSQLVAAGLVEVERDGRRRLHRLAGADVAHAVEALAALAGPKPVRGLRDGDRAAAERHARSCYDHLAGRVGVALTDRLCALGALDRDSLHLVDPGAFSRLGVDIAQLPRTRRPLTRSCLDWSERRPHLAGALGAALLTALLDKDWLVRRPTGRGGLQPVAGLAVPVY